MEEKKTAIIGSGPAGLTAAIYLSRANLNPTLFAGSIFGGQLMITTDVENFPGFVNGIQGPELMDNMIKQAKRFGTNLIFKDVTKVDFSSKPFKVYVGEEEYAFDAVVIATGASAKTLGIESESKLIGRGISYCATCDGAFFRGKDIGVVGGGDSAMEEALFLTKFASKVYLIHRRGEFRASKIMQQKVLQNEKIEVVFNSEVVDCIGEQKLEYIDIKDVNTNDIRRLDIQGLFIAIGHNPNTQIFKGQLDLYDNGYLKVFDHSKTSIEGIFSAGDVDDFRYKQAITAAGEGCKAALDTEKYLEGIVTPQW